MAKPKTRPDQNSQQSFWNTFPGVVTAIAALISAVALLIGALNTIGLFKPPVTPGPSWVFDDLIYKEDFEDGTANGIKTTTGTFNVVQTSDGNHVLQTSDNGTSELILPTESNDYAIQARIMQVSGNDEGQATFWIRMEEGSPCKPSYLVYMVVLYDQVRLVEKDSACNELQNSGLYADYYSNLSNGVWYTVRIEAKGNEVRVYWDGKLILQGKDTDGDVKQSNVIGFAACCNEPNTHAFDFDDIQVWVSGP